MAQYLDKAGLMHFWKMIPRHFPTKKQVGQRFKPIEAEFRLFKETMEPMGYTHFHEMVPWVDGLIQQVLNGLSSKADTVNVYTKTEADDRYKLKTDDDGSSSETWKYT